MMNIYRNQGHCWGSFWGLLLLGSKFQLCKQLDAYEVVFGDNRKRIFSSQRCCPAFCVCDILPSCSTFQKGYTIICSRAVTLSLWLVLNLTGKGPGSLIAGHAGFNRRGGEEQESLSK